MSDKQNQGCSSTEDKPKDSLDQIVLKSNKDNQNVNKELKKCCKVLYFSSECNLEDILETIEGLSPKEYPQLFCFIVDSACSAENQENSSENVKKLQESLLKFSTTRPIILQLIFEDKIFFKLEESTKFDIINQQQNIFDEIKDFQSFLSFFLDNKFKNFEDDVIDFVNKGSDVQIVLRFLRTLKLNDKFFERLVLEVGKNGSKSELNAVLDAPFDDSGQWINSHAEKYITEVLCIDNQTESSTSVLLTAIQHKNSELSDYLIYEMTHLIQQLPFDNQIQISTAAFDTNQLDVLCDLVDIADFPFPSNFQLQSFDHERLAAIVRERGELRDAIEFDDNERIVKYIEENSYLKIVYSTNNTSALKISEESKKHKIFNDLKLRGFHTTNPSEDFKEFEMKVNKFVKLQRKKNIKEGLKDDQIAVNLFCNRSLIHNKKISKEQEKEYRKKIRSWFEAINNVKNGPEFLQVAASCPKLKILFDFDNDTVENASLEGPNSSGTMYPASKWIFIGAKLKDKNGNLRDQKIKGVLAHELCHYVMKLVYQNQENPYFKHKKDVKKTFSKIVNKIKECIENKPEDQCNGIISTVFTCYNPEDFHPELIVRIIHILLEFDDSPDKLKKIKDKYKSLSRFWIGYVVPDMLNYLNRNEDVIKLNGFFQLLSVVSDLKYELKIEAEVNYVERNNITIVRTNVPMLLLINIHKNLQGKCGNLLDSKNVFAKPENLENQQICEYFKEVCAENQNLTIIVDCTKEFSKYLKTILINKEHNFIFVVSSGQQCEELAISCDQNGLKNATKLEFDYEWHDLTEESQNLLLETQINFQNNPQIIYLFIIYLLLVYLNFFTVVSIFI